MMLFVLNPLAHFVSILVDCPFCLSIIQDESAPRLLRPESKGDLTGRTIDESYKDTPRRPSTASSSSSSSSSSSTASAGRVPPGGRSTIDFGNDHGAELRLSSKRVQNKELIAFDPNVRNTSFFNPLLRLTSKQSESQSITSSI